LLSTEGVFFGVIVLVIGSIVWQFKHVRGIGDNMVTVGLLVLLANLLSRLQRLYYRWEADRVYERLRSKLARSVRHSKAGRRHKARR
jgi:hypothetical protein